MKTLSNSSTPFPLPHSLQAEPILRYLPPHTSPLLLSLARLAQYDVSFMRKVNLRTRAEEAAIVKKRSTSYLKPLASSPSFKDALRLLKESTKYHPNWGVSRCNWGVMLRYLRYLHFLSPYRSLSINDALYFTLQTLFRPLPNPYPLTRQPLSLLGRHALTTPQLAHPVPIRKVPFPHLLTRPPDLYTTTHYCAQLPMNCAPSCMMLRTYCALLRIPYSYDAPCIHMQAPYCALLRLRITCQCTYCALLRIQQLLSI